MSACTFFGHSDTSYKVEAELYEIVDDLISNKGVDTFYVGNHGNFDKIVRKVLKSLSQKYSHVKYAVVLAYRPIKNNSYDYTDTIYPEELCGSMYKTAILERNQWMIDRADYVITCVNRCYGGAVRFKELAEKRGRIVYNIKFNF